MYSQFQEKSSFADLGTNDGSLIIGLKNVFCYSGGTEATAMFPKVAETLTNQGFEILKLSETENPVYAVKFAENEHAVICFSKKYNDDFNPKSCICSHSHV